MQDIIQDMKDFMKKNEINQRQLANVIGCHESNLNRWLRGHHQPSAPWGMIIKQKLDAYKE